MKIIGSACFLVSLTLALPAQAGFFDDLKRKAEQAVQDATQGVMDGVVPGRQQSRPPEEPQRQDSQPAGGQQASPQYQRAKPTMSRSSLDVHQMRGLQTCLKRLGYYRGAPDGKYGPATAAAIRHYQRARNLPVDGNATRSVQADCSKAYSNPGLRAELKKDAATRVPAKASSSGGGQTASAGRYTKYPILDSNGGPASRKLNELVAVRFMPEAYSMEERQGMYYLEQAVSKLYPTEWRSIRDEFERRRKLEELSARLHQDAARIPLVYRFVFPVTLSRYDFEKQFFQIGWRRQLPVVPDVSLSAMRLHMPPDEAEQFKRTCAGNTRVCNLYMEWIVEIVGSLGPDRGVTQIPVADVRQVHIYRTSNRGNADDALLSNLVMKVNLDEMPVNNLYVKSMGRQPARAQKNTQKKGKSNSMEITF